MKLKQAVEVRTGMICCAHGVKDLNGWLLARLDHLV